jgi:hypothetical protein
MEISKSAQLFLKMITSICSLAHLLAIVWQEETHTQGPLMKTAKCYELSVTIQEGQVLDLARGSNQQTQISLPRWLVLGFMKDVVREKNIFPTF